MIWTQRQVIYRMAGNFGGEFILVHWQFWEQSANISSTKTLQCAVINIGNHSFHVYNRRPGVHHPQLRTWISRLQGVLDTGGERRVGLLTQSKAVNAVAVKTDAVVHQYKHYPGRSGPDFPRPTLVSSCSHPWSSDSTVFLWLSIPDQSSNEEWKTKMRQSQTRPPSAVAFGAPAQLFCHFFFICYSSTLHILGVSFEVWPVLSAQAIVPVSL